jgi:hypothetical protein
LQQEPDGRRVTQFGHNILTPSQSVALLYRYSVCKHFANGIEKDRNKKSWRCLMPLSTIFWLYCGREIRSTWKNIIKLANVTDLK